MSVFEPDALMLQNYMQNKLSDVNTERVELWLAENPEIIDELELDLIFKEAIETEQKTEQKTKDEKKKNLNFLDFFISRKFIPIHLFAYGLLAFLMLNTLMKSEQYSSVATFVELEKQRGLDTSVIVVKTDKSRSLVLRFFPDSMTREYILIMDSKSSNERISFEKLKSDEFGSITVSLNNVENITGKWDVEIIDSAKNIEQKFIIEILSV